MRRGAIVCGVLGWFVGSLLLATMAEARVGGGRTSGSRGSRSYSAPRTPSAPASPTSPASPTGERRSLTPAPGPQRPGGFLGGFGGMLGGFLLGGLLGSLLFGGYGAGIGGIGLLDVVLLAGLAYLAFALLQRRQPAPAMAYGSAPAGWTPGEAAAGASGGVAVADADDDVGRGIAAIRMMDTGFDPAGFVEAARDLFLRVQAAWGSGDLSAIRGEITDEIAAALEADAKRLRLLRRVNRLEKPNVEAAEVTEAWQELGRDFVTVRFRASGLDYTLDATTGAVVEGSNSVPTSFEEYWTFVRRVGPNAWRLSAIQQPPA